MSVQSAEAKENSTSKHVNVPGKPEGWVPAGDLQEVISLEEMQKLPKETIFMTGSEAARESIRRCNVDMAIAYPITPQSETMQQAGYLYDEGYIKDYYRAEEEIGTMSAISGASRAGVRSLTATSGPGLMRGMEAISSWPGARTPIVMLDMCRVINTPLAIQPDNIEVSFLLNTGMLVMHAENQQDFFDWPLIAFIVSEQVDVTLPCTVSVDGFFVTHARGNVSMCDKKYKIPPRDGWKNAVPSMDNENPPARISRDAPIQKSNFISYHMHASWQQEVFSAVERSAKYFDKYLGGLIEVINPDAEEMIIASGACVSQAREAIRQEEEKGRKVGLIKVKTIRPFPTKQVIAAAKHAKIILVPEFNQAGWLHKEVCQTLYGYSEATIYNGPRVFGGMTMPTELILDWLKEIRENTGTRSFF